MAEFVKVASLADVPLGEMLTIELDGDPVVLANVDGQVFAFAGECTHRSGPLGEGSLEGDVVICPWHSGESTCGRATSWGRRRSGPWAPVWAR